MTANSIANASAVKHGDSRQLLTFSLGGEYYGVDILRVQEIREWSPVTRIPQAPSHVLGVLNLRGSIVPIVDMRLRLNLASAEFTPLTVIIVLAVTTAQGSRNYSIVVDSVSDVVDIEADSLKPAPDLGSTSSADYILGLATVAGKMVILLDLDKLMLEDLTGGNNMPLAANA